MDRIFKKSWPKRFPKRLHAFVADATSDNNELPLHVNDIRRIDLVVAESYITLKHTLAWNYAKSVLFQTEKYESVSFSNKPRKAALLPNDVEVLLQRRIIRPMDIANALAWVNVFTVVELAKRRRRMIVEPVEANQHFTDPGDVPLPSLLDVMKILTEEGASTFDFTSYYNAFAIDEQMSRYFCFMHEGQCYAMATIPTGQRQCPCLAHALTSSIAEHCEAAARDEGHGLLSVSYIDNVAFAGSPSAVHIASKKLQDICDDIGITLRTESAFGTRYEFLGMILDHNARTVELGPKTRNKLAAWKIETTVFSEYWTMRDFISLMGLVMWAGSVLVINLAPFYWIFKFLRRRASAHLDEPAFLWPSIIPSVLQFIEELQRAPPRRLNTACEANVVAWTDASLSGFGITIFEGNHLTVLAGAFLILEDIQILEGRALLRLAQTLLPQAEPRRILVYIDNTSLQGAVHKRRANNFVLNAIVWKIIDIFRAKNWLVDLRYVVSKKNLSDGPSRWQHSSSATAVFSADI